MRRFPLRSRRSRALCAAALFLMVPALALAQANGRLQIHHINAGQGDGTLLISPRGQTALLDDGGRCAEIRSYLQARGITVVDYHFASHYHADQIGCIDDLAAVGITIRTGGYDRGSSYSSASFATYIQTLGARRRTLARDDVITLDAGSANPVRLVCVDLNGAGVYPPGGSDENAKSVVIKVSYGSFDEVIGGALPGGGVADVESAVGPRVGDVEVYRVHLHGSRHSTNDNWLGATTPEVAILPVGNGNPNAHPSAEALGRLHAHGVKTYWTETGAGAAPNPAWDRVASGAVVVQADPGPRDAYTVSGPGFTDTYYNGGAPPPPPPPPTTIRTTEVVEGITVLTGSITAGDVTRLAANDAVSVSIATGEENDRDVTDWYGSVTLDHPPLNLTVSYDGRYSRSRTQTLHLWNWITGAWDQVGTTSVGEEDATQSWTTPLPPVGYVSAGREVRLRVRANPRNDPYVCHADWMAFAYDYLPGTTPALATTAPPEAERVAPAVVEAAPLETHPVGDLTRVSVQRVDGAVELSWATERETHVDGFNVYREGDGGAMQLVGHDAAFELRANESVYLLRDVAPLERAVYWLGVRSCSAPETTLGPFAVDVAAPTAGLSFGLGPNPARRATEFVVVLEAPSHARIDVFDITGRQVATPFWGPVQAGLTRWPWPLQSSAGTRLKPGCYFARVEAAGRSMLRRLVVLEN